MTKSLQDPRNRTPKVLTSKVRHHFSQGGLPGYFLLAFLLTWSAWIPAGLAARGTIGLPFPQLVLFIVGGLGPLTAAVLMTARSGGRPALRRLFTGLNPRGVPKKWFAAALLLVPLNLTPVFYLALSAGHAADERVVFQALITFPLQLLLVTFVGGGLDEEGGWRGFALPRLLRVMHPLTGNILLGVVWSLWHLPLWLDATSSQAQYPFHLYLIKTVALSVLIGWLYAASGGSLAVAVFAHAVSNSADSVRYQLLGPASVTTGSQLSLLLALVLAALLVIVMTKSNIGANHAMPGVLDE